MINTSYKITINYFPYKKLFKTFLFCFLYFIPIICFSKSLGEYFEECEKCVNGQKAMFTAIDKYLLDNPTIKDFKISNEEEFKYYLKLFYEKKYINEATLGDKGNCHFRFVDNELYCIKHGSLNYVKGYESSKKNDDFEFYFFLFFSILGLLSVNQAIYGKSKKNEKSTQEQQQEVK